MVDMAARQARILAAVVKGRSALAPVPVVEDRVSVPYRLDHCTVSLQDKLALMESYNRLMLESGTPIVSTTVTLIIKWQVFLTIICDLWGLMSALSRR